MEPTKFTSVEKYEKWMIENWGGESNPKKMYLGYYQSGADDQFTLSETRQAYKDIKLKARALGNADAFEGTETTFLGHKMASPICIAPTAFHKLAHPDGELATARAADSTKTLQCLSSWSNCSSKFLSLINSQWRMSLMKLLKI